MKRDVQGKFALKNDDYRSVRSLRLTDSTWEALSAAAESLGITKADLLEDMVRNQDHSFPSNTRSFEHVYPSNTSHEKELEQLKAEVQHLHQENALLVERLAVKSLQRADLEAWRVQSLKKLNLGRQAPGYKAAQKALEYFIVALIRSEKNSLF